LLLLLLLLLPPPPLLLLLFYDGYYHDNNCFHWTTTNTATTNTSAGHGSHHTNWDTALFPSILLPSHTHSRAHAQAVTQGYFWTMIIVASCVIGPVILLLVVTVFIMASAKVILYVVNMDVLVPHATAP
jgi:hypothetical protein